jgi:hypothetical protein
LATLAVFYSLRRKTRRQVCVANFLVADCEQQEARALSQVADARDDLGTATPGLITLVGQMVLELHFLLRAELIVGLVVIAWRILLGPVLRIVSSASGGRARDNKIGNDAAGQGSNNSMLDQIRALKAMGYLRGNQDFEGMSQGESGVSARDDAERGAFPRRGTAMSRRTLSASIVFAAAIALGALAQPARAQSPGQEPPLAASEPLNAAERALATQHPDAWAKLTPEQRARVLQNYRTWRQMTPAEQSAARQNFEQFRSLPPEERQQVLQGLRRWRQLPPAERQHMLENYHRWQQMTPEQRKTARIRWRQFHPKHAPLTKIP